MNPKDEDISDRRVLVTMPSGEVLERTWGKADTNILSIGDVDPTIRDLVTMLNNSGFKTLGSCAGHKDRGFITFSKKEKKNREAIRRVFEAFDIPVRFRSDKWYLYASFLPQEPYSKLELID